MYKFDTTPAIRHGPARLTARFVLASASPRRAEILRAAGFAFDVVPAGVDENVAVGDQTPAGVAVQIAVSKARAVAALFPDTVVLAADTVVAADSGLLAKPDSSAEAREMLRMLRGQTHAVVTGVAVAYRGSVISDALQTLVTFRTYTDNEADAYVATGASLDKAGAYGIQDRPFAPAASYDGCYLNVVGLPLCLTLRLLDRLSLLDRTVAQPPCPGHMPPLGRTVVR